MHNICYPKLVIMHGRQKKILNIIVKEYIKTAEPVSSGLLVKKFNLPYSPATVRNELVKLEEEKFIYQPHTSAGRLPTAKAYDFYIKELKPKKITAGFYLRQKNEESLKQAAKILAEKSGLAVFWALHRNNIYYTGISNLLSQPEFKRYEMAVDVSKVIDQMEDVIGNIYKQVEYEPRVLIGEANPFGSVLGTVMVKYQYRSAAAKAITGRDGIFGIIGPMRMDYEQCLGLVRCIVDKL